VCPRKGVLLCLLDTSCGRVTVAVVRGNVQSVCVCVCVCVCVLTTWGCGVDDVDL